MKKIGFFGGCFNPPSIIHISIAINLIKEGKLDKVVFIPVNDLYCKKDLIEFNHRYNMLKLATKEYNNIEVSDIEIRENKRLYAKDIFYIIKNTEEKNDNKIFFIMGSDNFNKMPTWKCYNDIKNKYDYIVIERKDQITATQIREMIKEKKEDAKKYLSKEVYEYILKNNLYI